MQGGPSYRADGASLGLARAGNDKGRDVTTTTTAWADRHGASPRMAYGGRITGQGFDSHNNRAYKSGSHYRIVRIHFVL